MKYGPLGPKSRFNSIGRRSSVADFRGEIGTTLIEMLVVIVIFLIGILAVAQVFPKGLQLLQWARNESVATALARDQVEQLKAQSEQLPDMITAGSYTANGAFVADATRSPGNLEPLGNPASDSIDINGTLTSAGTTLGDWTRFSGANAIRHIVGEGRPIPAPSLVGSNSALYGGLLILQFGPLDFQTFANGTNTINIYGNDLTPHFGSPLSTTSSGVTVTASHGDDEYYVENPQDNSIKLDLPQGPLTLPGGTPNASQRTYTISVSAYVQNGTAYIKRDFVFPPTLVGNAAQDPTSGAIPFQQVLLGQLFQSMTPSVVLGSIDINSLRVRRSYQQIPVATNWTGYDAYAVKVLNPRLGVLLFSPYGFGQTISGPNGKSALEARIDYDVYDWRILREEFRFPSGQQAQHQLAVGSIKVGTQDGIDGRVNSNIVPLEGPASSTASANSPTADNFVLVDLPTGGVYKETLNGQSAVTINKSNGLVTVIDQDQSTDGTQATVLLPDGTSQVVTVDNRSVRALYMAKNEYAVQVMKAPSSYRETTGYPGVGEYTAGGNIQSPGGVQGVSTRIYFPASDSGRKLIVGSINYRSSRDSLPHQILDQDFVLKVQPLDPIGLPSIDISQVDTNATSLDAVTYGFVASSIKGASLTVRTLWNPDSFVLSSSGTANMKSVNVWSRGWRRATNETYLEQGSLGK